MRRVPISPDEIVEDAADRVSLPEDPAHHVRDVLRMEPGDPLELFDGRGRFWRGTIVEVEPRVVVTIDESGVDRSRESPCRITLLQAIPKGNRWDWLLEKSTELGVHRVVPLETERTVVRIPKKKVARKLERWGKIVEGAARQSGRTVVPTISTPMTIAAAAASREESLQLVASPDAEESLHRVLEAGLPEAKDCSVCETLGLWIGPEGGFTPAELELLAGSARSFQLGPRVLRSETAGMVAVALAQHRLGDLG